MAGRGWIPGMFWCGCPITPLWPERDGGCRDPTELQFLPLPPAHHSPRDLKLRNLTLPTTAIPLRRGGTLRGFQSFQHPANHQDLGNKRGLAAHFCNWHCEALPLSVHPTIACGISDTLEQGSVVQLPVIACCL